MHLPRTLSTPVGLCSSSVTFVIVVVSRKPQPRLQWRRYVQRLNADQVALWPLLVFVPHFVNNFVYSS